MVGFDARGMPVQPRERDGSPHARKGFKDRTITSLTIQFTVHPMDATPIPTPTTDADRWLELDRQLCFALYSTSLAMTKRYKPLLAPLGVTYPQYLVLLVLWQHRELGVAELGERLFLDFGTLSPLLKRMEASGWLVRTRDTRDERRVRVRLTESGEALRQTARTVPPQLADAMQCHLDEITSLTQRLQQLRAQLLGASAPDAPEAH